MANLTVPLVVLENIARSKSLLRRDEPLRGIDALLLGLDLYDPSALLGKPRFQAEVLIEECVGELNRQKHVKEFLQSITKSDDVQVTYKPGEEDHLVKTLKIIKTALERMKKDSEDQEIKELDDRKETLFTNGKRFLAEGEGPRATATFRVLADEFGHVEGVLVDIGELLQDTDYKFEALEFFEAAIEAFPTDSRGYKGATSCATELHEAEKAIEIYLKALRQFGNHPTTLYNLAKAYELNHQRDKAFEYALSASQADPSHEKAKEMVDKYS